MTIAAAALAPLATTAMFDSTASLSPLGPPRVEVTTFNIRYSSAQDGENNWANRREQVLALIARGDFVGLQEALPDQVRAAQELPSRGVISRTREADPARGEACSIVYDSQRWLEDPAEQGTFWLSETPAVAGSKSWESSLPRICTWSRFTEKSTGAGVYIFNTHFDHKSSQAREHAAQLLAARVRDRKRAEPAIVLGDLNCAPESAAVRELIKQASLTDAGSSLASSGTFNGWKPAAQEADTGREYIDGPRIDFVLVTAGVQVINAEIDLSRNEGRWPSDHCPVRASLVLSESCVVAP